MPTNNHWLLEYFENASEIARTINRSGNYVYDRIDRRDGKDFTLKEWELINKHIEQFKTVKNTNKRDIEKQIAKHYRELAKLYEELSEQ